MIFVIAILIIALIVMFNKFSSVKARKSRWDGWYTWNTQDSKGNVTEEGYGIRRGGEDICKVTCPRSEWPQDVKDFAEWMATLPKSEGIDLPTDRDPEQVVDAIWEPIDKD